jgi:hypothetical protein
MTAQLGKAIRWAGRVLATVVAITAGVFVLADMVVSQLAGPVWGLKQILGGLAYLLVSWAALVAAFALLLGLVNVITVHWRQIKSRRPNAVYSVVLLVSLAVTLVVGAGGLETTGLRFIFDYILQPLESTLFALLALFIATAAFRALRVRSFDTFFFVFFAVIVLLGQVPVGIYLWSELPIIKDWVLDVPTLAGMRGILLGVALGAIATGLRVLMGADRPYVD